MSVNYQLRRVAGISWLVDVGQEGFEYKKPIPLNESASIIWEMLTVGKTKNEIAKELSEGDSSIEVIILADIEEFLDQLESAGVNCQEVMR